MGKWAGDRNRQLVSQKTPAVVTQNGVPLLRNHRDWADRGTQVMTMSSGTERNGDSHGAEGTSCLFRWTSLQTLLGRTFYDTAAASSSGSHTTGFHAT